MRLVWKLGFAAVSIGAVAISVSHLIDDGGVVPVMRDEVPTLTAQWAGNNQALQLAAFIPASVAVAAGFRAGSADYDKSYPPD